MTLQNRSMTYEAPCISDIDRDAWCRCFESFLPSDVRIGNASERSRQGRDSHEDAEDGLGDALGQNVP